MFLCDLQTSNTTEVDFYFWLKWYAWYAFMMLPGNWIIKIESEYLWFG